jgi:hypothetical protein
MSSSASRHDPGFAVLADHGAAHFRPRIDSSNDLRGSRRWPKWWHYPPSIVSWRDMAVRMNRIRVYEQVLREGTEADVRLFIARTNSSKNSRDTRIDLGY